MSAQLGLSPEETVAKSPPTADLVWRDIDALREGKAIFTQPAGVIKCAGGASLVLFQA